MHIYRVADDPTRTAVFALGSDGVPFHVLGKGHWTALELAGWTEHLLEPDVYDSLRDAVLAHDDEDNNGRPTGGDPWRELKEQREGDAG